MYATFGRENLALTVFVPYDCKNACPFCTSKESYASIRPDVERVKNNMMILLPDYARSIREVVFTGGEPMEDMNILRELVSIVPKAYDIYINTTLTNANLDDFINFVNNIDNIKGVNISRHCETYEEDCRMLHDIAPDEAIDRIHVSVRINCVVHDQNIERVVNRWKGRKVTLNFRKDYTEPANERTLHDPYDDTPIMLARMGCKYVMKTSCNVCDTTEFHLDNFSIRYHKGLARSSVVYDDHIEINDVIIDQSGRIMYDWEECDTRIADKFIKNLVILQTIGSASWDAHHLTYRDMPTMICGSPSPRC